MPTADPSPTAAVPAPARRGRIRPALTRALSVRNLAVASVIHSVLFTGLMVCAFLIGKPQPATFVFGFSHGVMFMAMGVAAAVAAHLRTIGWITAIVVIVIGAMCPYFGTADLLRDRRRRRGRHVVEVG